MSSAHLHLLLNHLPVLGTVFGLGLLLWGLLRKQPVLLRAALAVFVLSAGAALVAYLTGEPAEEQLEEVAAISGNLIESHEESATLALGSAGVLGALALALLVWFRGRAVPKALTGLATVLALVTTGMMARTANLGGQIRHPEITAAGAAGGGGETADALRGEDRRGGDDD